MNGQTQITRPFFDVPTLEIIEVGTSAINVGAIEEATLALMELGRRTRSQAAIKAFRRLAKASSIEPIEWLEHAPSLARSLESSGTGSRSIYVALLRDDEGRHGVYVGQTGKERDQRFAEHKAGYKASKHVRKHGIALLPRVQHHLTDLEAHEANEIEADLAEEFRNAGIWTEGGH